MAESKISTWSSRRKVGYCILYTFFFAIMALYFHYYSTRPNYDLIKNYIIWYYIIVGIGWSLSILLILFNSVRNFVKEHLNKFSPQDILLVLGSLFLSFPLLLYIALSSDTTKNILPASIQFNVIELSGVLGGIVLAAAAVGTISKTLQSRFFTISKYLISSTILLAIFTIFSYNADIKVSNLTTVIYSGAAEWVSVICFYLGSTFFFMGIIKLLVTLFRVKKYIDDPTED